MTNRAYSAGCAANDVNFPCWYGADAMTLAAKLDGLFQAGRNDLADCNINECPEYIVRYLNGTGGGLGVAKWVNETIQAITPDIAEHPNLEEIAPQIAARNVIFQHAQYLLLDKSQAAITELGKKVAHGEVKVRFNKPLIGSPKVTITGDTEYLADCLLTIFPNTKTGMLLMENAGIKTLKNGDAVLGYQFSVKKGSPAEHTFACFSITTEKRSERKSNFPMPR